jgi:uncharacterized protein YdhG (YjbR/CyaY superfamily)
MPTQRSFASIDEYIRPFPKPVRDILARLRKTIRQASPEAVETISYQLPAFRLDGRALVYFGAWKSHIGFYAMPSGNAAFRKELARYQLSKGSVRFPIDQPIPYNLVEKMVRFRIKEIRVLKRK